jgi:hypothetical protein
VYQIARVSFSAQTGGVMVLILVLANDQAFLPRHVAGSSAIQSTWLRHMQRPVRIS